MAAIKVVLIKSKVNSDGESPVKIQVNHNYKTRRKTLFYVNPKCFSKGKVTKKHKDYIRLNNIINRTLAEYMTNVNDLEHKRIPYSVDDIFRPNVKDCYLLVDVIMRYQQQQIEANHIPNSRRIKNIADKVKLFDPKVNIDQVDKHWVDRFANFLRNCENINSEATVGKYIKGLKAVLREEKREGNFRDERVLAYKNPKSYTEIEFLTLEESRRWQHGDIPERLELYRDFFTFLIHCMGERVSDVLMLQPDQIRNGHIHFREIKTGARIGTGKVKVVRVNNTLQSLIDKYKGMSNYYVFPLLKQVPSDPNTNQRYRKHIDSLIATTNKRYKLIAAHLRINKNVTNHVARHTYASLADEAGIDLRDIQFMLNHSKMQDTINYVHSIRKSKELNNLASKVLDQLE